MNVETKAEEYPLSSGDADSFLNNSGSSSSSILPAKYRARLRTTRLFAFVVSTIAVGLLLALIVEVTSEDGGSGGDSSAAPDYDYHAKAREHEWEAEKSCCAPGDA